MLRLSAIFIFLTILIGLSMEDGTTPQLEEIFTGRCYDYDLTRANNPLPEVVTDCSTLWTLFKDAFAYQSSCGVDENNYKPFIEAAAQDLPVDKSLFWSGTWALAHRLSQQGHEYVTMEDSLIGYLVDSLSWCGQETSPGIDYDSCPGWDDCQGNSNSVFWDASSTWFAEEAEGEVFVLLDGSNPDRPAYKADSFFATVELPNMNPEKVTTVIVMLVHRFDKPQVETCTSGTLITLREDVLAKGLQFTCEINPDSVLHLLCVDDPTNRECNTQCVNPRRKKNKKNRRGRRHIFF